MTTSLIFRRLCVVLVSLTILFPRLWAQTGDRRIGQIASALQDEQYDKALQMLHVALAESPANSELWTMQGVAFKGTGNTKDALGSFRRALKLAPDNIPALQGAAQIEFDQADAAGIPILEHLLKLHPTDLTSHAMVAILEYQQGHCTSALPHFEKALPVFEQRPAGLHAYAACLVKQKQFSRAA